MKPTVYAPSLGLAALAACNNAGGTKDLVVMDDFVYGEAAPAVTPARPLGPGPFTGGRPTCLASSRLPIGRRQSVCKGRRTD